MKTNKKEEKIKFSRNLKIIWELAKKYKFVFVGIAILILVAETMLVVERYLFKRVIDYGTSFGAGAIKGDILVQGLILVAVIYLGAIFIVATSNWIQIGLVNRVYSNMIFDMKKKFFSHLITLSNKFHSSHKTGSLISRMNRGAGALENVVDFFVLTSLPIGFQTVLVIVSVGYFDFWTTIATIITIGAFMSYSLWINKIQQKSDLAANNAEDSEKGSIADIFTNVDSVKYYGKEQNVIERYLNLAGITRDKRYENWNYYRYLDAGQAIILGLGSMALVALPIWAFIRGEISIGTVAFIYTSYTSMLSGLFRFLWATRRFYHSMADAQALFNYLEFENEIKDAVNAGSMEINKGEIVFEDIKFSYNKKQILKGASFRVKPGEKVAIVGHSGSGKTTLIKMLYRFYDVDSGKIMVDNQDISKVRQESLRSSLSIVPQECILFDDTIYNNIAFSNEKANRKEIMEAIKFAQLDKFISGLPLKEKTIVGERGVKLSGGEKQRVSIARAILANKKILVLDEATSALDSKTEFEIQKDLARLMKGRTSLIIAHRLSTIMSADKIIVLHEGEVVQQGTHRQLIAKKGPYKELWELQKGGYIEE